MAKAQGQQPSTNGVLSKEEFLERARAGSRVQTIPIKELGGSIRVRELSRGEILDLTDKHAKKGEDGEREIDSEALTVEMMVFNLVEPQFTLEEITQLRRDGTVAFWNEIEEFLLKLNSQGRQPDPEDSF
jgi:hypothetical protein